jgi:hypothetical protein
MTLIYIIFIITVDIDLTFLMYIHAVFVTVVPDDGGLRSAEDEDQLPNRSQTPPTPPADRSDFDVHEALLDDKVRSKCHTLRNSKSFTFVETIIHIIQIITIINIVTRNLKYNVRYIQYFLETSIDFLAQRSAHLIMVVLTCVRVPLEKLTSNQKNSTTYFLSDNLLYTLCVLYLLLLQVAALLKTLELQESALRKGNYALFNCLVIGNTNLVLRLCYDRHWLQVLRVCPRLHPGILQ